MHTHRRNAALVAALLAVAPGALAGTPPTGLAAGRARGTYSMNGKPAPLAFAYAALEENPFDEQLDDIVIVLTDVPVSAEALAGAKELEDALGRAEVKNYVTLKLREAKPGETVPDSPGTGKWYLGSSRLAHAALGDKTLQSSPDMSSRLEPVVLGPQRVEGKLSSGGPRSSFGDEYEFSVAFNTAVRSRKREAKLDPQTAERLAPGGGEPGKAYLAMIQAVHKGDLKALEAKLLPAGKPVTPEMQKQVREMLPMLQAMTPKDARVLGGLEGGDQAALDVEATQDGQKHKGTIEMTLRGGNWSVTKESWR